MMLSEEKFGLDRSTGIQHIRAMYPLLVSPTLSLLDPSVSRERMNRDYHPRGCIWLTRVIINANERRKVQYVNNTLSLRMCTANTQLFVDVAIADERDGECNDDAEPEEKQANEI